jgi:hypothetical protein
MKKTERQGSDQVSKMQGGMFTCQLMHRRKLSKNKINGSFIETKQEKQSKKKGIFRSAGAVLRTASQT